MRILLINPPRSPANAIYEWAPAEAKHLIHRKLIGPPLGLLTIAAAVRDDHDVELLEMKGEYDLDPDAPPPAQLLTAYLESFKPDIAGLTFIASEHPVGMELLRVVKRFDPGILTVAGGLHAQLCPGDFDDPAVDVLCVAHAPQVFQNLVTAYEKQQPLDTVGGVMVRDGDALRRAEGPLESWDAAGRDFIPPDRSLIERWRSTYVVKNAPGPTTYLFTSLGCPHKCSFCSIWPQFGGRYHQREVESIIEELKTVDDYPVVRFADGNSVVDLDFAERLFDRIEQEGIKKQYVMDIRVDTAAREPQLIEKMARNGLKVVIAGFESFRDDELERFNKKLRADLIAEAVSVFHANDIMVRGNYVISPDYTKKDFDALAEHASQHAVALAGYTILTPMPGTQLYGEMSDTIVDHDLSTYNFFNCVLETAMPLETFYEQVSELWRIRLGSEVI
jgi:radical SAM superfamily enzyme YgiQ (UPF0313 family)